MSHPFYSSKRSRMPSSGGRAFEETVIGSFLSKSSLPSLPGKPFIFFEKPKLMNDRDIELASTTMWHVNNKSFFYNKINFHLYFLSL